MAAGAGTLRVATPPVDVVQNIYFLRCELAGTVNDSMEVRYRIWSGEKTEQKRNRKW